MKIVGIIPARYESSRFPGKPLVDLDGKPMIQRVYEQCLKADSLADVYVATDNREIEERVLSFGGKVVMTGTNCTSGTERCLEASQEIEGGADVVINVQGDEPFIEPDDIDLLASHFDHDDVQIATLVTPINSQEELENPNRVKAVLNKPGNAIYFSRTPVPYQMGVPKEEWLSSFSYLLHLGIYGYRVQTLTEVCALPPCALEQAERLEQLRWIENGYSIAASITHNRSLAIDEPGDVEQVLAKLRAENVDGKN